jgi:hypothetical protein
MAGPNLHHCRPRRQPEETIRGLGADYYPFRVQAKETRTHISIHREVGEATRANVEARAVAHPTVIGEETETTPRHPQHHPPELLDDADEAKRNQRNKRHTCTKPMPSQPYLQQLETKT